MNPQVTALRHGVFAAVELLGRSDWSDRDAVAAITSTWTELDAQLTSHALHEDMYIFPMLEERRPGPSAALRADHGRSRRGRGHPAVDPR